MSKDPENYGVRLLNVPRGDDDDEARKRALLAVLKIYDDRGASDPEGCATVICALGLGDFADEMVEAARKRRAGEALRPEGRTVITGSCSRCGKRIRTRKDGTVGPHPSRLRVAGPCDGEGHSPVDGTLGSRQR